MSSFPQFLRSALKVCLAAGPLPQLIQSLRSRRCLSVLTYHSVIAEPLPFYDWTYLDAAAFRQQMDYLRRHFAVLPLTQALHLLRQDALPGPTAALTFDDGFRNNHDVAFPILREYRLPSSIYLATDLIGTDKTVWFARLLLALQTTRSTRLIWNGTDYPLDNAAVRAASSARLQAALKKFPAEVLERALYEIETLLAVPHNPSVDENSPFRMLDRTQIGAMLDSGLVEFGAHTCGHTILSRLTSAEKAAQIANSVQRVAAITGQECSLFAYPNGAPQDFDAESQELLAAAGIKTALTMIPGANRPDTPALATHRYPIGADTDFRRFRLLVHNVA